MAKKPSHSPPEEKLQLVRVYSDYDDDPVYIVATADKSEIARIQQRGDQLGYRVSVGNASTFSEVWKFFDLMTGKG
jgi:hypothetical protein